MAQGTPPVLEGPACHHIYIVYDRQKKYDSSLACVLANDLEDYGFKVEWHENTNLEDSPLELIGRSLKIVVLVTKSSFKSQRLLKEIKLATMFVEEELRQPSRLLVVQSDENQHLDELASYPSLTYQALNFWPMLHHFASSEITSRQSILPPGQLAYPLAWSYFFGFLNLTLPARVVRDQGGVIHKTLSLPERIRDCTRWMEEPSERNMPLKMFILIPESCYCPPNLEDAGISHSAFIHCSTSRAGNPHRDYKSSVYKIVDESGGKEYYFVGEYVSAILCMYEMCQDPNIGFKEPDMRHQARLFYYALMDILDHGPEDQRRRFRNKHKIIFLRDEDVERLTLREILLPIIKEEIRKDLEIEAKARTTMPTGPLGLQQGSTASPGERGHKPTSIPSTGVNVPAQQEILMPTYPMTHIPRGKALIINVVNFQPGLNLSSRFGADKDIAALEQTLGTQLKFETHIVTNPTKDQIWMALDEYSSMDHSSYDCFICVVLTHGKPGLILSSDGQAIGITNMTRQFAPRFCPTLKNKPKIFFIQACQGSRSSRPGEEDDLLSDDGNEAGADDVITGSDIRDNDIFENEDDLDDLERLGIYSDAGPDVPGYSTNQSGADNLRGLPPRLAVHGHSQGQGQGQGQEIQGDHGHGQSQHGQQQQQQSHDQGQNQPSEGQGGLNQGQGQERRQNQGQDCSVTRRPDTLVPTDEDFIIGYATLPGSPSYRVRTSGSLYIQALCEELKDSAGSMYLHAILRRVTNKVKNQLKCIVRHIQQTRPSYRLSKSQVPFFLETASRYVQLKPAH